MTTLETLVAVLFCRQNIEQMQKMKLSSGKTATHAQFAFSNAYTTATAELLAQAANAGRTVDLESVQEREAGVWHFYSMDRRVEYVLRLNDPKGTRLEVAPTYKPLLYAPSPRYAQARTRE